MTPRGADTRALAALSGGAILIGLAPIFVRVSDVGPVACAFWRCLLAWPLLAFALGHEQKAQTATALPAHRMALIAAGLFFAVDLALWHEAIGRTSIANATLLANLAPLFVAPAAWWLWRETVTRHFLAGMAVAIGGTAILIGPSIALGARVLLGDAMALIAAVFYAGYLLTVARLRRRHSTLQVMTWSSGTVALVLLPLALALGETIWPQTLRGWLLLLGLAWLTHAGGQGLIARALATLPASFSSVGLLVQPLAASIFAWALLGEFFGAQQAVGGLVILAGIALCRWSSSATTP